MRLYFERSTANFWVKICNILLQHGAIVNIMSFGIQSKISSSFFQFTAGNNSHSIKKLKGKKTQLHKVAA